MKWDIYKAKSWMLKCGMEHIEEGFFTEGGELVFEAKWGTGCETETYFRDTLERIVSWAEEDIDDAVKEVTG